MFENSVGIGLLNENLDRVEGTQYFFLIIGSLNLKSKLQHIILICNALYLVGSKCEIFRPRSFNTGYIATELISFSFLKAILRQYVRTILWLIVLPYHHLDFAKSCSTTPIRRTSSFVRNHVTCVTNVRNTNNRAETLMIVFYLCSVI